MSPLAGTVEATLEKVFRGAMKAAVLAAEVVAVVAVALEDLEPELPQPLRARSASAGPASRRIDVLGTVGRSPLSVCRTAGE